MFLNFSPLALPHPQPLSKRRGWQEKKGTKREVCINNMPPSPKRGNRERFASKISPLAPKGGTEREIYNQNKIHCFSQS